MSLKVFGVLVFLFAMLGFSAEIKNCIHDPMECTTHKVQDVQDPSLQILLNEYRRNKLSRLDEILRKKRNRLNDAG
ncbi:hypothetical protein AWC38_SpisGene7503 [Stylophora pistillata]|uniref:Uncharacterized protein n=1 Tax=Stylophora pistillata TaxID=50429 RepID=A0A2B4SEI3_STYPI|nr:hypothetical protein AWC38_SpisGene7503 [Stylophora pistillata]